MRGLSEDETYTVVSIWCKKHGRVLNVVDWEKNTYLPAWEFTFPKVQKWNANQYWKEVRRIATDPTSRLHCRLRISYFLTNERNQPTASEITDKTGIPVKTVRYHLGKLQESGKVEMVGTGVSARYKAIVSEYWNRADDWKEDGFWCVDLHPELADWGQTINERTEENNLTIMKAYDYCKDNFVDVIYDRELDSQVHELEWLINAAGDVVANGKSFEFGQRFCVPYTGRKTVLHKNGDRLDFCHDNLTFAVATSKAATEWIEVDYLSRLLAA
jgi:DNA-binding transcriptional ArsR family regulator